MPPSFRLISHRAQCELIAAKYDVVHISTGDLLRAEVAAKSEAGLKAQEFMDRGDLVPDEVVIAMVKSRLAQPDAQAKGWLLDGYPRSGSQGEALSAAGIAPQLFLLLNVPDDVLIGGFFTPWRAAAAAWIMGHSRHFLSSLRSPRRKVSAARSLSQSKCAVHSTLLALCAACVHAFLRDAAPPSSARPAGGGAAVRAALHTASWLRQQR